MAEKKKQNAVRAAARTASRVRGEKRHRANREAQSVREDRNRDFIVAWTDKPVGAAGTVAAHKRPSKQARAIRRAIARAQAA